MDPICGSGNLLVTATEHHNVHIYGKENNLDYYLMEYYLEKMKKE